MRKRSTQVGEPEFTTLTTYLMDSEGNRAQKVDGTTTVYYIRGADGAVLAERASRALCTLCGS